MLQSILTESGKCLYVVPLNALAYEKYQSFRLKYGSAIQVGISTGDYESSSRYLERYDIIVLTLEKLDSLTRLKPAWLRTLSVVVVDEVHVIGEEKRGPRLEGAMARFMSLNPGAPCGEDRFRR
jgi:helicase